MDAVTSQLFFGEDVNYNGQLDAEEDDGNLYLPADNSDGQLQLGLIDLLTVYPHDEISVNTCTEGVFRTALTPPEAEALARAIVEHRRGTDRLDGTGDDKPFDNRAALEAILGAANLQRLSEAGVELGTSTTAFRFYFRVNFADVHRIREAGLVALRTNDGVEVAERHDGL